MISHVSFYFHRHCEQSEAISKIFLITKLFLIVFLKH